ncbi:MAG: DUF2723 domain-containing protein [Phycisphaerales bacterium]|nr:DUF2723 domain-containing protein [Phycisphaerales bacterium]
MVRPDGERRSFIAAAVMLGLLFYGLTCAPGVLWQDSATFQYRVCHFQLRSNLGLALAHPLYILLAKAFSLIPVGNIAFRVNLFSAVCAAVSLGFVMDLVLSLTRSRIAAVTGTILIAVSHTFWRHAVMAEVYSLYAVGLLVELWLLERFFTSRRNRWLILALFINGLNVSNHLLALLHLPVYGGILAYAVHQQRLSLRKLPLLGLVFLIGMSPYLALIMTDLVRGQPFVATVQSALFGNTFANKVLNTSISPLSQCFRTIQFFALNFPTPIAWLAPVGAWWAWKDRKTRWFGLVGGGVFTIAFVFAFRYPVPDQYVFFFPCYILLPVFAALVVPRLVGQSNGRKLVCLILAALPIPAYEIGPTLLERWNLSIGGTRQLPYRNKYTYFIRPSKHGYDGAERFAREALAQAAPDGLLVADSTIMNVLSFVRDVEGVHRGVSLARTADVTPAEPAIRITRESIRNYVERHGAYLCTDAPGYVEDWLLTDYDRRQTGVIFQLRTRASQSRKDQAPSN